MNHPRIQPNGAMCDRCNAALTPYHFDPLGNTEFVCASCMTPEERARFESLNKKESQA